MWDSCEIEDEEGRVREWGIRNEGSLDTSEEAKGLLYLDPTYYVFLTQWFFGLETDLALLKMVSL